MLQLSCFNLSLIRIYRTSGSHVHNTLQTQCGLTCIKEMFWKLYSLIKMYKKLTYWRNVQNYRRGNKIMSRKYTKIFGFSHSSFLGITKPSSKWFNNFNLKLEMEARTTLENRIFSNFARHCLKNHISSFLSPKFINFIPLENRFKGLQFSRRHLCKILSTSALSSRKTEQEWKFSQIWKITDIHRNWEKFWNFHGRKYSESSFKRNKQNSIWIFLHQDITDFPRLLKVSCGKNFQQHFPLFSLISSHFQGYNLIV